MPDCAHLPWESPDEFEIRPRVDGRPAAMEREGNDIRVRRSKSCGGIPRFIGQQIGHVNAQWFESAREEQRLIVRPTKNRIVNGNQNIHRKPLLLASW
jgi:hypothetical protein